MKKDFPLYTVRNDWSCELAFFLVMQQQQQYWRHAQRCSEFCFQRSDFAVHNSNHAGVSKTRISGFRIVWDLGSWNPHTSQSVSQEEENLCGGVGSQSSANSLGQNEPFFNSWFIRSSDQKAEDLACPDTRKCWQASWSSVRDHRGAHEHLWLWHRLWFQDCHCSIAGKSFHCNPKFYFEMYPVRDHP